MDDEIGGEAEPDLMELMLYAQALRHAMPDYDPAARSRAQALIDRAYRPLPHDEAMRQQGA